jgi:hypothetical protein|tara:strand:- start:17286 stop:17468 length:183 start_codon:yes stop_codon:yes gene_type:complete
MATKSWLKKEGHTFTEYNISNDVKYAEDLMRMGFRVTPVTIIGSEMIVGFSPTRLEKALR